VSGGEDWLQDPLMEIGKGSYQYRKPKSLDEKQYNLWQHFHFATRLKLDGAEHFCRQVLGAASMPDDLGLPLLAHRQLKWYLDAFFFELMSAYDTLPQELNIVYAYDLGLKPEDVRWERIKSRLPNGLVGYMDKERNEKWFDKTRRYRNIATHHYLVPTGSWKGGWGDQLLDYTQHQVFIHYLDDSGNLEDEEIIVCIEYLKKMVKFISHVWEKMAQEFR